MARRMFRDHSGDVYRVIISGVNRATDREYREVFGPYATLAAAKGLLTTEMHYGYRREATGHIERAVTVWEVVE